MIDRMAERPFISILILTALCGWLFFLCLGGMALTDPDETFYAETAKEMFQRNDWVTSYLCGKPQFEKPPLFYWLIGASYKVFGVNEFAARFPSAALALVGVIALYLLGSVMFNRRAGFLAAVTLATCVEYLVLARSCITDMALGVLMLLGALFFFYARTKEKGRYYLLSSVAFALATLTKGPVFAALPVAAIFVYAVLSRDFKIFKPRGYILLSVFLFFAIAAPWYMVMYKLHGKSFTDVFFGLHNMTRFFEFEHRMGSQWYYNIPIVFGGFFPWSVFLPFGFWHAARKLGPSSAAGRDEKRNLLFALVWFFVIFLFFSVSSTKLPTYIFPSFISLALITGVLWDDFLKSPAKKEFAVWMPVSYYILPVAVAAGSAAVFIFVNRRYPPMLEGAMLSSVFLGFGIMLSTAAFLRKRFAAAFLFTVYAILISLHPICRSVLPKLEPYETSKEVAAKVDSLMKPGQALGSEHYYMFGIAFYTGRFPLDTDKHHIAVQFMGSKGRVWVVMKEKNHIQLYTLQTKPYCMTPSYVIYKAGKKTIVTNMEPEDGRYIIRRERND